MIIKDKVFEEMERMFGEDLADPEIFPKKAMFQYKFAEWELANKPVTESNDAE